MAVRHGRAGPRLVGITPAMREGSGMVEFRKGALFDRYTTWASPSSMPSPSPPGWPAKGLKPVVAIYSTFCSAATTS